MTAWHELDVDTALSQLQTSAASGLDDSSAAARLARDGANELTRRRTRGAWTVLFDQFRTTLVGMLVVAAVVSAFAGDKTDAVAVLAIVVLNAALGFAQDYRAERAMAALVRLAVPSVRVRRSGRVETISARSLVAGDVMLLEAGNVVAADARLIEAANLQVDEAALTGESHAVFKDAALVAAPSTPLAERQNMVYMGTAISQGRGVAVITATGMHSELGQIAALVETVSAQPTPLQRRLDRLGRGLAVATIVIAVAVFAMGIARGEQARTMFLTAVSLAVAAVPEGLPAVVTMALALGSRRMLQRRALVRRLSAVEGLGSVDVICTDKTGTLTENRMEVAAIELPEGGVDLDRLSRGDLDPATTMLLTAAALCNDATVDADGGTTGDPTEVALMRCAVRAGLDPASLGKALPRTTEAPFDSARKRMSTVHRIGNATGLAGRHDEQFVVFSKGAPGPMLAVSRQIWTRNGAVDIDREWTERTAAAIDRLASRGMRVLAVAAAYRQTATSDASTLERDLTFLGLVALADPPRPEAAAAVDACKAAGIRPVMITGDHPLTAQSIAAQLGIGNARATTGPEIDNATDDQLDTVVADARVFARVSPVHKLRLVRAYTRLGHTVAMTGDGVNDAPALKQASIGIAMGVTGTDVAKEVADIVLLDDNFATIVAAVEEGRLIYDNLRKFVKYLLTTNSGELLVVAVGPLLGLPLPLLPLQILWVNLVSDGPSALMIALEPPERDVMRRPPARGADILSTAVVRHIVWMGALIAVVCLVPGYWYYRTGNAAWQTMIFTIVMLAQQAHVLAIRRDTVSWRDLNL
ncbi:MAG TPA: cation-translocating P-type ATPase, partial [Vicinamibacterales bacterium]|nr:cation-translocating P-type ATPase [Vicinamibacterales bacterium]